MKLWILTRTGPVGYDEYEFHVVSAKTPEEAREIASSTHGDEGPETWLQANRTKCEELIANNEGGVMCSGFRAG